MNLSSALIADGVVDVERHQKLIQMFLTQESEAARYARAVLQESHKHILMTS
jgi:hypothetical protein